MYRGWRVVVMSAFIYMLVTGTTYSAFGVFVVPVSAEFNLSRADMNSGMALLSIGTAVLAPILGRILDRVPTRPIIVGSSILLGGGLIGLGLSQAIWIDALILLLPLAIGVLGTGNLAMPILIARWFVRQRGRAMALSTTGMSMGSVVVPPIVAFLVTSFGWRMALIVMGASAMAILVLLALTIRVKPGAQDIESPEPSAAMLPNAPEKSKAQHATAIGQPFSIRQLFASAQFWLIGLAATLALPVALALSISLVPLALDSGHSLALASSLASAGGLAAIAGGLLISAVADRFDRVWLMSFVFMCGALVNVTLLMGSSYPVQLCGAIMLGLVIGAQMPLFYTLLADRFGAASFGTARGFLTPMTSIGGMVAVRLAGEIFDRTGNYRFMFIAFIVTQLIAAALIVLVRLTQPMAATLGARQ